jgi:hypothetical protein
VARGHATSSLRIEGSGRFWEAGVAKRSKPLVATIGAAVIGGALLQELRKPPEQREWHGRFVGIPYDFRPPTLERFRRCWWNPNDPRIFTERDFGVGWSVNFPALARFANEIVAGD